MLSKPLNPNRGPGHSAPLGRAKRLEQKKKRKRRPTTRAPPRAGAPSRPASRAEPYPAPPPAGFFCLSSTLPTERSALRFSAAPGRPAPPLPACRWCFRPRNLLVVGRASGPSDPPSASAHRPFVSRTLLGPLHRKWPARVPSLFCALCAFLRSVRTFETPYWRVRDRPPARRAAAPPVRWECRRRACRRRCRVWLASVGLLQGRARLPRPRTRPPPCTALCAARPPASNRARARARVHTRALQRRHAPTCMCLV